MTRGLIDADLGGGLVKKRLPLAGRGKRGGARVIVATNQQDRWFMLHGYEKSERDNLSRAEQRELRFIGSELLSLSWSELESAATAGYIEEISHAFAKEDS